MTTRHEMALEAACRAHAPQFERMDPVIQKYARLQMQEAIATYLSIAGKGEDGWADMSSAPKDGTDILAWHPHWRDPEIVAWNSGEQAWCNGSWCWNDAPTHWLPLPTPPSLLSEDTEGGV